MKKTIAIIGGGPAAMMFASSIDKNEYTVTIYEKNNALGRKFLVAGDGGFNLTHSETAAAFVNRYFPTSFFEPIISSFSNNDLQNWLKTIGIETFVGTSKRVFPIKGIKPIDVLNAIIKVLEQKQVTIKTLHKWAGWNNEDELVFINRDKTIAIKPDVTVFALGGGSWKVTGSDGSWLTYFKERGIETIPFQPSNCAMKVDWCKEFLLSAEGKSIKNIAVSCGNNKRLGEIVITNFGLEGGAVYAMSSEIRKQLSEQKSATLFIDLKPNLAIEELKNKLINRGNKSISQLLANELNINETQLALLKTVLTKQEFISVELLSEKIKKLPIIITGLAAIDEAISTVGGISLDAIDTNYQLKKLTNNYVIGEMLDWEAPTGGYLLQACFSMGHQLATHLSEKK